jgi:hypothetical protein
MEGAMKSGVLWDMMRHSLVDRYWTTNLHSIKILNLKSLFVSKRLLHNTCRFKSRPGLTCYFDMGFINHLFIDTKKNSVEKHFTCIQNDCCTFGCHSNKYRAKYVSSIQKITLHVGMHPCQIQKNDVCAFVWHHIHTGLELNGCNNRQFRSWSSWLWHYAVFQVDTNGSVAYAVILHGHSDKKGGCLEPKEGKVSLTRSWKSLIHNTK